MKKHLTQALFLAVLFLCLFCLQSTAEEQAQNIAKSLSYKAPKGKNIKKLFDGGYKGSFMTGKKMNKVLEMKSTEPLFALSIRWVDLPGAWCLEEKQNGTWQPLQTFRGDTLYSEFVKLSGQTHLRLRSQDRNTPFLAIYELEAYGKGKLPEAVQQWQVNDDKKDILLLSAHPDDELLFFGGLIPTYANDPEFELQVAYLTYGVRYRRFELLNGLWHTGLKNYPSMGIFGDVYGSDVQTIYRVWHKNKALKHVVNLIRKHRPEVVVTHDVNGEYGHGAHKAAADLATEAFTLAADPNFKTALPPWQAKKLYVHLGKNPTTIDWEDDNHQINGKTSLQLASEAFAFHESQQKGSASFQGQRFLFRVVKGGMFDNGKFTLLKSTVGEDELKNDFFEHIPMVKKQHQPKEDSAMEKSTSTEEKDTLTNLTHEDDDTLEHTSETYEQNTEN